MLDHIRSNIILLNTFPLLTQMLNYNYIGDYNLLTTYIKILKL